VIQRLVIGLVLLAVAVAAVGYGIWTTMIVDPDNSGVADFFGGIFIAAGFVLAGVSALILRSANARRGR
jgi:hypothetical protein